MRSRYVIRPLRAANDWREVGHHMAPTSSGLLPALLETLRGAGCRSYVEETAYIDRDFSSAYAAFYSTLYKPYTKYCRRFHFFKAAVPDLEEVQDDAERLAAWIAGATHDYLGFVVVRPVQHAPVSHAMVSAVHVAREDTEIAVRCQVAVHLLGLELSVTGFPITEQDMRTGACAQAALWTAGRFRSLRHAAPWFSMPQITEAAILPADTGVVESLPAGSDHLSGDSMVRALRAMGSRPKYYGPVLETGMWEAEPGPLIARYLDSGVPVIIGLSTPRATGHAVVAVGAVRMGEARPIAGRRGSSADRITHFVVNDDQRGAYRTLPLSPGRARADSIPFDVASHADFVLIPLPDKVFMTAEIAEEAAWDKATSISANRLAIAADVKGEAGARSWGEIDREFHERLADGSAVARTYLTTGWKYKQRILRNGIPPQLKQELRTVQLPRYVWVTEFSLPGDNVGHDPCGHRVRSHVIVDATGSRYWDSVILTHVPGIMVMRTFDVSGAAQATETVLRLTQDDGPYLPKIRGWMDYDRCAVPRASAAASEGSAAPAP